MLNIRTIILSVTLVVIFVLTIGQMAVRTEGDPAPSGNLAGVLENQERSTSQKHVDAIRSYRSSLGECFDVAVSEASECLNARQTSDQSHRSRLDVCFDVSLRELANCRKESQMSVP